MGGKLIHGHAAGGKISPEYAAWQSMIARCRNPNCNVFKYYGGRGVKVCERWLKCENFIVDMGKRPSPDHSLDRIDNEGGYEPSNCRWATRKEQRANRRKAEFCRRGHPFDAENTGSDGRCIACVKWRYEAHKRAVNMTANTTAYVLLDSWAGRTKSKVTVLKPGPVRTKVRFEERAFWRQVGHVQYVPTYAIKNSQS